MHLLSEKEKKIEKVIQEQLNYSKRPMLSLSWGKDSFLLLTYLLKFKPDIDVVYLNSGYGLSDNYKFRDNQLSELNVNYHEIEQQIDYIDLCKLYGLPHLRIPATQRKVVSIIKKDQLDRIAKDIGCDVVFWGLRADESRGRFGLSKKGYWFDKKNGLRFVHPLIYLSQFELWWLYDYYNLPINDIYTKTELVKREQIRNSGWLSTDGTQYGRLDWLSFHYPEEFSRLIYYFPDAKRQA